MALAIRAAGHAVTGHARPGARDRARLVEAGVRLTPEIAEAAADAEVVVCALFDDAQLREVLIEAGGLAALAPGAVLAVHTTGVPAVIEALAAAAPAGAVVLDAPFSGVASEAATGCIRLFVGGEAAALERARPVLSAYCDPILPVGAVGAARRLKLVNNLLLAANVSLAAEALEGAARLGVDPAAALAVLRIASGRSFGLELLADAPVDAALTGLARWLDKDVDAAREALAAEGLDLPLLTAAARWGRARDGG